MHKLLKLPKRILNRIRHELDPKARLVKKVVAAKEARLSGSLSYTDHPRLSLILLSFNHRSNVEQILSRLRGSTAAELIVVDDGSLDGSERVWLKHLTRPNEFLIRSNDIHEIRAYNRAVSLARGELVCILQDDDIPPADVSWVDSAISLFDQYPKLAILGGHQGYEVNYSSPTRKFRARNIYGFREGEQWKHVLQIPFKTPNKSMPFMFVEGVSIGPIFYRREVFERLGGFDLRFSKPGEPGILADHEICLKAWLNGWQVALYGPVPFTKYVGGQGTVMFGSLARKNNMSANVEQLKEMYADRVDCINKTVGDLNSQLLPNYSAPIQLEETNSNPTVYADGLIQNSN